MDDALLDNRPDLAWPWIERLRPQVIRYNLDWPEVAPRRPDDGRDPNDDVYRFGAADRVVRNATRLGIPVVLTIVHTPRWAGGGAKGTRAPKRLRDLEDFSYAAAARYAGQVSRWTAWNEPNLPDYLTPQAKKVGGRWVRTSPRLYAGILRAIYQGVHDAGRDHSVKEVVAGGVTSPYGCGAGCDVPSIAPLTFLRDLHRLGAPFDVWAHHPYRIRSGETPTKGNRDPQVSFGNLGDLRRALDKLYPRRHVKIWLTEFGYQTNPPDTYLGVSPARQAAYLADVVRIARRLPGVDMLIWFMIRDEDIGDRPGAAGFQTGLVWASNRLKPGFSTYVRLTTGRDAESSAWGLDLDDDPKPVDSGPTPRCPRGFDARPGFVPGQVRCVRREGLLPAPETGWPPAMWTASRTARALRPCDVNAHGHRGRYHPRA